ncbi:MAG: FHA domain-containing protein [Lachnospiraceae bacterium]|nr:FHA domain-containing protein [Lachnospiraceae bacterium]
MRKISFRVRNFENEQFLTFNIDNEAELDEELLDFVEDEEPAGIVPVIFEEGEEFDTFSYNITDKIHLSELSNQEINAEMVLRVLRGLILTFIDMAEYRIPLSYLVLNRNYIYVDSDYKIEFICVPLEDMKEETDLISFLRNFMASLRFEPSENGDYVAKLFTYINNRAIFNLRNLLTMVEELMESMGIEIPEEASAEIYAEYHEVEEEAEKEHEEAFEEAVMEEPEEVFEEEEAVEEPEEAFEEDIEESEEVPEEEEAVEEPEEAFEEDMEESEEVPEEEEAVEESEESFEEEAEESEEAFGEEEAFEEGIEESEGISEEEEAVEEPEEAFEEEDIEESEEIPETDEVAEEPEEDEVTSESQEIVNKIKEKLSKNNKAKKSSKIEAEDSEGSGNSITKKPLFKTKETPVTGVVIPDELDEFLAEKEFEEQQVNHEETGLKIKKNIKINRASIVKNTQEELKAAEEALAEAENEETPVDDVIPEESGEVKEAVKTAPIPKVNPYLIRVNTEERIMITKQTFKLGKASMGVDYTVKGNGAISRVHAIITNKDDDYYIKDNKSTNHTFVNGKVIEEGESELLTHDCKIVLGDEEFIFKLQ